MAMLWTLIAVFLFFFLFILVIAVNEDRHTIPRHNDSDNESEKTAKRKLFSCSGLVCIGFLVLLIVSWYLLPVLARARESGHYSTIENNLKQWGLVFKVYANESPGEQYPPLTQYDNLWVPDLNALYPEYLTYPDIVKDPGNPSSTLDEILHEFYERKYLDIERATRFMAQNYVYPGWLIHKDMDMQLITQYRTEKSLRESGFETKFPPYYWMRKGIERFLITDINDISTAAMLQPTIPLMIARPRLEEPKRGSRFDRRWFNFKKKYLGWEPGMVLPVLFFDDHVEKIPLEEVPDHIKALIELFPEPIKD